MAWLFRLLHSTDYFEQTYLTLLSNRILNFKYDLVKEQTVIAIFRSESTENFKSTVDQMLVDTQASIDCKHTTEQLQVVCVDVKVWPIKKQMLAPEAKIKLPQQLNTIFESFLDHYKQTFKAKLVQPCIDLGMCVLFANISKSKKFELETTPIQAMVLL